MVNSEHQTNIKVIIPSLFRRFTNNEEVISMVASTIKESMKVLTDRFPDLKKKLYDEKGDIAKHVNFYINKNRAEIDYRLRQGDEVMIFVAVAGG